MKYVIFLINWVSSHNLILCYRVKTLKIGSVFIWKFYKNLEENNEFLKTTLLTSYVIFLLFVRMMMFPFQSRVSWGKKRKSEEKPLLHFWASTFLSTLYKIGPSDYLAGPSTDLQLISNFSPNRCFLDQVSAV